MAGVWLEDAGFEAGERVRITVEDKRLIIIFGTRLDLRRAHHTFPPPKCKNPRLLGGGFWLEGA
ncbi:SymE family type I addiction module toxin [Burkholderia cenocepacia]|uniref:SymE family type I addiction module toxin n=1 Tax=Burkholderia cenocepacia TaxID=95486 RepID=UPI002011671E|nr:SymE family type I addiction module toxin [Burkholderia cenocepacia]